VARLVFVGGSAWIAAWVAVARRVLVGGTVEVGAGEFVAVGATVGVSVGASVCAWAFESIIDGAFWPVVVDVISTPTDGSSVSVGVCVGSGALVLSWLNRALISPMAVATVGKLARCSSCSRRVLNRLTRSRAPFTVEFARNTMAPIQTTNTISRAKNFRIRRMSYPKFDKLTRQ
jgi:hypothetical protein